MKNKLKSGMGRIFTVCVGTLALLGLVVIPSLADRGGWTDPPGGWQFVEEWHEIPRYDTDPEEEVWLHDSSSDSYSGNAHTELFQENGWEGGDVVRIDTIPGAGDTEDGSTPAEDAMVFTMIDLGEPRVLGIDDPSDRKLNFIHVARTEDGEMIEFPYQDGGITLLVRYRVPPIEHEAPFQEANEFSGDPPFIFAERPWTPPQYDRVQVGLGYIDEAFTDLVVTTGVGYYAPNSLWILGNYEEGGNNHPLARTDIDDPGEYLVGGIENHLIRDDIDTTEFHSIWLTAQAQEEDPWMIDVSVWIDGEAEPALETVIQRGPDAPTPPDPNEEGAFPGFQTNIEIGAAATNNFAAFQFDYIAARFDQAIPPEPSETSVQTWELY